MTVQRHEEHKEVVTYNTADARPGEATPMMATQTETITGDPHAARRSQVAKIQQAIYMLFGILEGLLGIRFVLGLLGANPGAGFAQFIYGVTAPFLAPFVGLFGQPTFEGVIFEWNALVAILVYALLAWVIVKLVVLGLGDSRRGVYTATSSRIDTV
jgi:hypothetical protein